MERKQIGAVAIVVGVLAVLLAVLADTLGIGGQENTFGWKQILLLAVGVAIAIGGVLAMRAPGDEPGGGDVAPDRE